MKAVSPVRHPSRKALAGGGGGCCCGDGGGGVGVEVPVRCLADAAPGCLKGSPPSAQEEQEDRAASAAAAGSLCLQCDMNDCYSRLRKLVPTIPPNKRVSKVEILQHVIDYILDLQLALETHPALLRQQQQAPMQPPPPPGSVLLPGGPPRTPLSTLNADPAGVVNKQGDSILCR